MMFFSCIAFRRRFKNIWIILDKFGWPIVHQERNNAMTILYDIGFDNGPFPSGVKPLAKPLLIDNQ